MGDKVAFFASAPAPANDEPAGHPEDAILFIGVSLVFGVICRRLFKGTRVPYTVALLILGICLGAIEYGTKTGLGTLGSSIRTWSSINPELILFVFLPALLFESSFAMEVHQIKRCIVQMVLLAGPGVVISTACLALVNHFLFPYGWNWSTSLLLGGLLSATDPVAVVALLKELGASKKLSTIVEGESLMNDGTAIVVYKLFFQMVLGQHFTAGDIVKFFTQVSLGACALGIGFGLLAVFWIGRVFNDTVVEITLTLTASYMAFFVAEDEAHVSGVLTVMTVGMTVASLVYLLLGIVTPLVTSFMWAGFFAAFARTAFTGESQQSMHHFWEMISYIANTLIFILSGTVIAESVLRSQDNIEAHDWGYLLLLYVFLQLSRAVVVVVLFPGLRYFGYGLDWKEAAVLIWAGLRGAVALSLSLSVAFVFFTGGIVFLTLILNGTTTQFLLKLLRMDRTSETKGLVLDYVRHQMYSKALDSFGELGDDEDLGPADWTTVCKYITCLGELSSTVAPMHPHEASVTEEQHRKLAFQDTRIRFLNGVQAAYWGMLEEGRITRTAAILLMRSVDEALDQVAQEEPLQDWKGVQPHVHFPKYLKWRSSSMLPGRLLRFFIMERLELGCYMAAAFLRAHRQARRQLRDFIGESQIADAVIKESQDEGQEARNFLEDVRLSFPQVLRVIKTKQVTYAVLVHLCAYVKSLEEAGLLEGKETNHLHDIVQVDLKKLQIDPPVVEMPSALEALRSQPFFGALPSHVQSILSSSARELMMLRDITFFREDGKADGVWFIANGNVKWNCQKYEDQHVLHPIFSHGSTLGLYEALTGKPLLCSVTADTVVHCFFLDNAVLMSTLKTVPTLEDFFWQESALVVAKLVVPQQLEAVTMQELRALILEGSHMRIYIRGEMIEVEVNKIGILLEGFIKQEGKEDVISAPAGLLGALLDTQPRRKGSRASMLITQSLFYHAEARSRVLFFDLQSGQFTPPLQPMGSGLLPSQAAREHSALMRFPSKYRNLVGKLTDANSRSSLKSWDTLENPSASYSAKAMELSLFGSQVSVGNKDWRHRYMHGMLGSPNLVMKSHPTNVRRAVGRQFSSAHTLGSPEKYDGTVPVQRRVQSQGNLLLAPSVRHQARIQNAYSSAESDTEEDHIVEIASPSSLFHTHYSVW